ncbi:nucleoside recognition domain-containing protein [Paenisporosarcina sp. TG20]|uniref:nucleoside recognition domain-containing protein n=1 Tax=Paenisporosarcina sp. TG20 TaxID=1211706 RepID=UPI0002DB1D69|nr:nucleoside recognition domain-containing protein [Paenisporosarcina sp. TG20]
MNTIKNGLLVGLKTSWTLSKIIFPITLILVILQYTPVFPWIIDLVSPIMGLFGLRGDAAIPLVLGNVLSVYAAIAGILSLELTVKEVFILAVMLSFSHNMFIETAVALKVGVKLWVVLLVRFGLAAISAIVINLVWSGGSDIAQYGIAPIAVEIPSGWMEIVLLGLQKASFGVLQLAMVVIPLMVGVQYLKDKKYLQKFSQKLAPFMKLLGIAPNASMTLVSGLVVGLAFGAGIMIQALQDDGVSKKDVTLVFIFLVACHAIIEDTLIFIPLGIPILPLFLLRLSTACVLTIIVAAVWKRAENQKRKEVLTS